MNKQEIELKLCKKLLEGFDQIRLKYMYEPFEPNTIDYLKYDFDELLNRISLELNIKLISGNVSIDGDQINIDEPKVEIIDVLTSDKQYIPVSVWLGK